MTLFLALLTGITYMVLSVLTVMAKMMTADVIIAVKGIPSWAPDGNWLLFLLGLASADVAQFALKRWTYKEVPVAPVPPAAPAAVEEGAVPPTT
jgi:phosphotransferase system  glucose/maltose/N-acetylglucosamine-specific IIC component